MKSKNYFATTFFLSIFLSASLSASTLSSANTDQKDVNLFVVGHQDDWQLFMNPEVYRSIESGKKTVFIYTTAGDAGNGAGKNGKTHPYYLARENGATRASHFLADIGQEVAKEKVQFVRINGHKIFKKTYKGTVSYFLRLPDGNMGGEGFPQTQLQSLERFKKGQIQEMAAVDGTETYKSWQDLRDTLQALISAEINNKSASLNIHDPLSSENPDDHSDHLMTSELALEATNFTDCIAIRLYKGYATSDQPENLNLFDKQLEAATFGITITGQTDFGHGGGTWEPWHLSFLGRSGYRTSKVGTLMCKF